MAFEVPVLGRSVLGPYQLCTASITAGCSEKAGPLSEVYHLLEWRWCFGSSGWVRRKLLLSPTSAGVVAAVGVHFGDNGRLFVPRTFVSGAFESWRILRSSSDNAV